MKDKFVGKVRQVSFHRNGIGGEGFHAVLFEGTPSDVCTECGTGFGWQSATQTLCDNRHVKTPQNTREEPGELMLAIQFDSEPHSRTAILNVAKLSDPAIGVAFGENSFRGDRFAEEITEAIRSNDSDGSVKMGSFAIPTKRKS